MGCKACDKPKPSYRKGLWSPEEDQKLRDYILLHGHGCWSALPAKAGKTTSDSFAAAAAAACASKLIVDKCACMMHWVRMGLKN
jgi:hypothetical protein